MLELRYFLQIFPDDLFLLFLILLNYISNLLWHHHVVIICCSLIHMSYFALPYCSLTYILAYLGLIVIKSGK